MQANSSLTVGEAATQLGISPQRVHALIRAGGLKATRVGRQLLVDPVSLHRRAVSDPMQYRPFSPTNAWALIDLASGDGTLQVVGERRLSPWSLSRMRGQLKRGGLLALSPYLRGRARVHELRADPDDVERIADEPGLVRTGVSAAREHGLDIVAPNTLEAYVPLVRYPELVERYVLESSHRPNVILHVVDGIWPFSPDAIVAPGPLAALDLYDSGDARGRRAGEEYLRRLEPT